MQGFEVYSVLRAIGAKNLHHANSVATSCTFLEQGGLASRGYVEDRGLTQTPQSSSDEKDRRFGVWHSVFLDDVDIHYRAGRKKGQNQYGPVLFVLELGTLLGLAPEAEVGITKDNPQYWQDGQPVTERWFGSPAELAGNIILGEFKKMIVVQTPSTMLSFPGGRAQIILDDPQRKLSNGEDAFTHAEGRLKAAAQVGGIEISVGRRQCRDGCLCAAKYSAYTTGDIDFWFS